MKTIFYAVVITSLFLVACNTSNDNWVTPPPVVSNQCLQTTNAAYNHYGTYNPYGTTVNNGACNSQLYNQYSAYGFSAYPYTTFKNFNYGGYSTMPFCDCPAGSRPVYSGTIGMGL